jgi:DNA-directed RNA polymerase specialized sigma subunit
MPLSLPVSLPVSLSSSSQVSLPSSSLQNVFLSRADLDSLSKPKTHLEEQFRIPFETWKEKQDDESRERLLQAIMPVIRENVSQVAGADKGYMTIQGKILALKAMERYDPSQSSIATYLNRQLMPLRRTARQQMNVLGIPDRVLFAAQQLEGAETELEDALGRPPTTVELADKMSISVKQIERIRRLSHARNSGNIGTPDEEGGVKSPEVTRTLDAKYRHEYVMDALANDPITQFIYETDNRLNGRRQMSTIDLAKKLRISPGAVSQRRNKINVLANRAEKAIYG